MKENKAGRVSGVMEGGFGSTTDPVHIKDNLSASRYVSAGQEGEGSGCTSCKSEEPLLHQPPIYQLNREVGGGERRRHIICIKHTEEGGGGGLQMASREKAARK